MAALGARFFDENGVVLPLGGGALSDLRSINLQFFDSRLANCQFVALCDVTNELYGLNGAAHVYAPQKGASPEQVKVLDTGLKQLADVVTQEFNKDYRNTAGAGAAGGIGFGLLSFLDAEMRAGIETVLEATAFDEEIENADLILTGEGALDSQTLSGKTIAGVCESARAKGVPVIAIGGKVDLNGEQMNNIGLQSAFSIVDAPRDLDYCLQNASGLISDSIERILRLKNK
jgi:glycerate kinase